MNFHCRISCSYAEASAFNAYMASRCSEGFIYEHPSDGSVNRTHIHCVFYQSQVGEDSIRQQAKKCFTVKPGRNDVMVTSTFGKEKTPISPESRNVAIAYCSKGKFSPKWVKDVPQDIIQAGMESWVPPAPKTKWKLEGGRVGISSTDETDEVKKPPAWLMMREVSERLDTNNITSEEQILDEIEKTMKKYNHKTSMYDMLNWYDNVRFYSDRNKKSFRNEVLAKLNSRH